MSMSKIECFIESYKHINQNKMYDSDSDEVRVLEALGDFADLVDILQFSGNSLRVSKVEKIVAKWGEQ